MSAQITAPSTGEKRGEPNPDQLASFDFDGVTYREYPGVPFIDGARPEDVGQGRIGNCYFMAALAAVAYRNPKLLVSGLTTLPGDAYRMRYYNPRTKQWTWVTLQGRSFPVAQNGAPAYGWPGTVTPQGVELWPMLYEKAYANLMNTAPGVNGYNAIGHGGGNLDLDALEALTGQMTKHAEPHLQTWEQFTKDVDGAAALLHTKGDPEKNLFPDPRKPDTKLFEFHAYWVSGVDEAKKTVHIHNPHLPHDPGFDVPWADVQSKFSWLTANPARPTLPRDPPDMRPNVRRR